MSPIQESRASRRLRGLILDPVLIAGGVETIRIELLPRLAEHFETLVWALPECACEEFRRKTHGASGLKIVPLSWPKTEWRKWARAVQKRATGEAAHPGSDAELTNWLIERFRPDFLFTTCVFDQPAPETPLPLFGMVCDVNPVLPESTRANIRRWADRSAGIMAISDFTRDELRRACPGQAGRIQAAPLAHLGMLPAAKRLVARPFTFLFPAAANGHKEHLLAFQAAEKLANERFDFRLVLTGPGTEKLGGPEPLADSRAEAARKFLRDRSLLGSRILARGSISKSDLDREYTTASAMLLPSSYEGFGLPLAEGLARGLPVVCSDIPAHLEQLDRYECRDRARVFACGSVDGLAEAMKATIEAPPPALEQNELARRMKLWTWSDTARRCAEAIAA